MELEALSKIEILENGEMYLILASGGRSSYQHIYREAAEVYWDNERKAFKAPTPRKWSHSQWFKHIVEVTANVGIKLVLSENTEWVNVASSTREEICLLAYT